MAGDRTPPPRNAFVAPPPLPESEEALTALAIPDPFDAMPITTILVTTYRRDGACHTRCKCAISIEPRADSLCALMSGLLSPPLPHAHIGGLVSVEPATSRRARDTGVWRGTTHTHAARA
jgi:hypothetical protein